MCVVRQPPPPKVVHDKMETTVCLTVVVVERGVGCVDLQRYEGVNINVQNKKISNVIYQGRSMQECVACMYATYWCWYTCSRCVIPVNDAM
jgi:hypothetical protein